MKTKSKRTRKPPANRDLWEMREEDKPHIGDIWSREYIFLDGAEKYHYLLLRQDSLQHLSDDFTFLMLNLETGEVRSRHMNFELDDWWKVT